MLRHIVFVVCLIYTIKIGYVVSFVNDISQLKAVNLDGNSESDRECKSQLDVFINGLEKRESWAVESKQILTYLKS